METKELLRKARMQLYNKQPFFSYLTMFLRPQRKDEIQTIGVNIKGDLYYNEEFIQTQEETVIEMLLSHEVAHLFLHHFERFAKKQPNIANVAEDLAINDMLQTNGFNMEVKPTKEQKKEITELIKIGKIKEGEPLGCVPNQNHEFEIQGIKIKEINKKDAETIYRELEKKLPKKYTYSNGFDKHDYEGAEEKEGEEKGVNWDEKLVEAATIAKQQGKLPAGMERLIDQLLTPKILWKEKLRKYIIRTIPTNYSYARPHKKSITTGYYMPDFTREKIEITVSIDTSGSIGQEELTEFLTEIVNIAKSFEQIKMHVIVADAKVHAQYPVENGSIQKILDLKMIGGGGTSHSCVLEHIKEKLPQTKCLVAFTDGYSDINNLTPPQYNVLWVINKTGVEEKDIKWGEVVKLE